MTRWRTGTKNPHNIYLDDEPVGFIMDAELAQAIVERLECFPTVEVPGGALAPIRLEDLCGVSEMHTTGPVRCAAGRHSFSQRNGYGPCWCGEPPAPNPGQLTVHHVIGCNARQGDGTCNRSCAGAPSFSESNQRVLQEHAGLLSRLVDAPSESGKLPAQPPCRHKFVGGKHCVLCGWVPR